MFSSNVPVRVQGIVCVVVTRGGVVCACADTHWSAAIDCDRSGSRTGTDILRREFPPKSRNLYSYHPRPGQVFLTYWHSLRANEEVRSTRTRPEMIPPPLPPIQSLIDSTAQLNLYLVTDEEYQLSSIRNCAVTLKISCACRPVEELVPALDKE